jgi:hypothetical protein
MDHSNVHFAHFSIQCIATSYASSSSATIFVHQVLLFGQLAGVAPNPLGFFRVFEQVREGAGQLLFVVCRKSRPVSLCRTMSGIASTFDAIMGFAQA